MLFWYIWRAPKLISRSIQKYLFSVLAFFWKSCKSVQINCCLFGELVYFVASKNSLQYFLWMITKPPTRKRGMHLFLIICNIWRGARLGRMDEKETWSISICCYKKYFWCLTILFADDGTEPERPSDHHNRPLHYAVVRCFFTLKNTITHWWDIFTLKILFLSGVIFLHPKNTIRWRKHRAIDCLHGLHCLHCLHWFHCSLFITLFK